MSHSATRPLRLRERIGISLLGSIERLAASVLRRGPLRKQVLNWVHRELARIHLGICGKNDPDQS